MTTSMSLYHKMKRLYCRKQTLLTCIWPQAAEQKHAPSARGRENAHHATEVVAVTIAGEQDTVVAENQELTAVTATTENV